MHRLLPYRLFQWYSPFWLKVTFLVCRFLYNLEIFGVTRIPTQGPFLWVINHASKWDSPLFLYLQRRLRADAYVYGGGGPLWSPRSVKARRMIPAPRGVGRSGQWLWSALKMLQQGYPILIAPEGTIRWDGRLQPFKPGAAWLALRSGAPIVVSVLRGGYAIWPRWARFPRLTGKLEIRIGEPFRFPAVTRGRVDEEMLQAVNRRIADEMRRLEENREA